MIKFKKTNCKIVMGTNINIYILHFTFLFSLVVFVSAAGHYFRIWTGQVQCTCIILDKKYNIANSSCYFGSYGSIWTGPSPKKYYMDLRSFGPYDIFWVTHRFIYCHITLSAMNYLLYMLYIKSTKNLLYFSGEHCSPYAIFCCTFILNVFITINCLRVILQNKQNKKCYLN